MVDATALHTTLTDADPWVWARQLVLSHRAEGLTTTLAMLLREMAACAERGELVLAVALAEEASSTALRAGDWLQAETVAQQATAWAEASGERRARGSAGIAVARVAYHQSDEARTLQAVEAAWAELQDDGDAFQRIDCMTLFGAVLSDLRQDELALPWHQQALDEAGALAGSGTWPALRRLAQSHSNVGARLVNLGLKAIDLGDQVEGQKLLVRCVEHAREACDLNLGLEMPSAAAIALSNAALALAHLGRHEEALAALDESDLLRGTDRGNHDWINSQMGRAQVWMAHGDLDRAEQILQAAMADARAIKALEKIHMGLLLESHLAEARGDLQRALASYKAYHEAHLGMLRSGAEDKARLLAVRMQTDQVRREAEHLRQASMEDPLTGLANRRALDASLAAWHRRARLSGQPLCVAMLDIDHFKHVNDEHSHAVGDAVLRRVGSLLRSVCRGRDLAARYGGEEFVLAFEDAALADATAVCERLRRVIEQEDWSVLAPGLAVTASIGVHDAARDATPEAGLGSADQALYRAKCAGRNQVQANR